MAKKTKIIHVGDNDDSVGYGRPPKHSQFKKGQSGNPKGRKRKSDFTSWGDPICEVLFESLTLPMKGKQVTLPSIVWMLRAMRNNAIKGDSRSFKILVDANGDRGLKGLWHELREKSRERTREELDETMRWLNEELGMAELLKKRS